MARSRVRSAATFAVAALVAGLVLGTPTTASARSAHSPVPGRLAAVHGSVDARVHNSLGPAHAHSARHLKPGTERWLHPLERRAGPRTHGARDAVYRPLPAVRGAATGRVVAATVSPATPSPAAQPQGTGSQGSSAQQRGTELLNSLLGRLIAPASGLVNGTGDALDGIVKSVRRTTGGLLDDGASSPSRPKPGASGPHRPGTPSTAPSQPRAGRGGSAPTTPATPTTSAAPTKRPGSPSPSASREAQPAPAQAPSLIGDRTAPPSEPTSAPSPQPSSSAVAVPQVPVSPVALLAPRVWVLVLAIGLFAIAVLFLVLGAGYRGGRRTR